MSLGSLVDMDMFCAAMLPVVASLGASGYGTAASLSAGMGHRVYKE